MLNYRGSAVALGSNIFGGGAFKGKVAALRVYTEALDATTVVSDFEVLAPLYLEAPETIPSLMAWYDASQTATVTTSGPQVTNWADRSMNSHDLAENTPSIGAITVNTAVSPTGLDAIHFDGTSQNFLVSHISGFIGSAFAVYRYDGGATFTEADGVYSGSATSPIYGNTGTSNLGSNFGSRRINGANTIVHGDIQVFNQASTVSNSGTAFTRSHRVGNYRTSNNRAWHGDIAEVIIFSEELTASQRLRIEAYQKNKWGTP